jgi:hypothetical protein
VQDPNSTGAIERPYEPPIDDNGSRINTADAMEAHDEFSRFDQGPLLDQPAFIANSDSGSDTEEAVPPPIARHPSRSPLPPPPESSAADGIPKPLPVQERWARLRKKAERAAQRETEEQGLSAYSKPTDGDDDTSGEESKWSPPPLRPGYDSMVVY